MPFISPSKVFVYLCMCLKRQRSKGRQLTILPMTLPMREGLQSCRCVDKSNLIYKNVAYWNERTHPFWISSWSSHTERDEWLFSLFFFFFWTHWFISYCTFPTEMLKGPDIPFEVGSCSECAPALDSLTTPPKPRWSFTRYQEEKKHICLSLPGLMA